MTLSLLTEPDDKAAAYRPIIWEVQSDRTSFESNNVTAVADSGGGFCQLTVGSNNFKQFDTVVMSGFTDPTYNVTTTVTAGGASTINVNVPFNATDTGVVTRANTDFKVQATLFTNDGQPISIATATLETDGNTRLVSGSNHGLKVGDWVNVTGTTSYNGIQQVLRVPFPNSYVIEVAFVAPESGTSQNLNRLGVKKQAEITVGSDNLFRFNFSNFLSADLSHDIAPITGSTDVVSPNDESEVQYIIQWVEQYNDLNGLLQDRDTLDNDTGKQAYNVTLQHTETQDLSAFTVDSSVKRFLTNTPQLSPLRTDEEIQLHFITDEASLKVRVIEYDQLVGGIPTNTTTSASKTITDNRGIATVEASGLLAATKRIEVRLINDAETTLLSEAKSFKILAPLCDHTRIKWLNRLGGIDSYTFTGDESRTIDSNKPTFTRGLDIGFGVSDFGDAVLGVEADNSFSIWSEFLNEDTAIWLEELVTSPQAWRVEGTDQLPIIVRRDRATLVDTGDIRQLNLLYRNANRLLLQNG